MCPLGISRAGTLFFFFTTFENNLKFNVFSFVQTPTFSH